MLGLGALGAMYYQKKLIKKPKTYHHSQTVNLSFLNQNSSLQRPYAVTPWLINPHLQIIYNAIIQAKTTTDLALEVENIRMPDDATTQLVWLNQNLPADTPTIVILHTITGSPSSMKDMLEDLSKSTGWRIVMCLRRGHSAEQQPFTKINIMGDVPDFKVQLQHIQQKFPQSNLYAVGSSAGTALLARYLGESAQNTPFKAAFAYAPGYDIETAFDRIYAPYDWYMAKKIKKTFFLPHQTQLMQMQSYQDILKINRLSKLQKELYDFAGFDSYTDYLAACNPIQVFSKIAIPTLILNAEDDPICHIDNAKQYLHIIENNPYLALVTTKHGSHCMHYQGWRHPKSWAHQLIADFCLHQQQTLSTVSSTQFTR